MIRLAALRLTPVRALALAAVLLAASFGAWTGLGALKAARGRLALVEQQAAAGAAAPQPLLTAGAAYHEEDRRAAAAALLASVRQAAAAQRLLVERIALSPPAEHMPAALSVDLGVSGSEADIARFARAIEGARPAIRFARWRIARTGRSETAIRLEARAVAWWEPR